MTRLIRWCWLALSTALVLTACNSINETTPATASSTSSSPLPAAEREAEKVASPTPLVVVIMTPVAGAEVINHGEHLYAANCAPCHQPNGEGVLNSFPALNGNPLVLTDDPLPAIDVVLYGRGVMPSFEGALSAQQIAAILSYVRNAWSNEASIVSAEQVQAVQEAGGSGNEMAQEQ